MQSTTLRTRPVWKSTKPDDPAGLHLLNRSTTMSESGRHHWELRTTQRCITVQALVLYNTAGAKEMADKVGLYASEARAADVLELVVIVNSDGPTAPSSILTLTQVQLLSVQGYSPTSSLPAAHANHSPDS